MATTFLDGNTFKVLLEGGCQSLIEDVDRINDLNVFPVPDGDTGTNMRLTIEGGVQAIMDKDITSIGQLSKDIARAMTMSARGNSGVILSQFFKGMSLSLCDKDKISPQELVEAFEYGVKQSYKVVQKPTEGTMLTVMREATEKTREEIDTFSTIEDFFDCFINQAYISLERTPELLKVLKDANVIDSGGAGYVRIIEGMIRALDGKLMARIEEEQRSHIKEENHDNKEDVIEKKYAVVAVSPSENISEVFKELGADVIVTGGQTMNPSSNDFINAFKKLKSEYIYVFPNNKNIVLAASQASEIYEDAKVIVLSSVSIPECYSALTMLDYSSDDFEEIKNIFEESIANVTSVSLTYATRDSRIEELVINKNDYLGFIGSHLVAVDQDKIAALQKVLFDIDMDEKQVAVVIYGKDVTEQEKELTRTHFKDAYPLIELGEIDGGQDLYSFLIDIE